MVVVIVWSSTCWADVHIRRGFFAGYVSQWKEKPEVLAGHLADLNADAVVLCPGNAQISYKEDDAVCKFLDTMHENGISVGTYMLPRFPAFKLIPSCRGTFEHCPIGQFSVEWEKVLTELAKYGYDGITVIPDEWYWSPFAYFPECVEEFHKRYGKDADPKASRRIWAQFCYSLSKERARAWAKCVKEINPKIETTVLLSLNPIWGRRVESGVAWDDIGYIEEIDGVTSDPYLVRHDPPSHWYVAETAKHLVASSSRRNAEVVLQCMQHLPDNRELTPVEVYGSALSSIWCGAKGVWFYGLQALIGETARPQEDREAKYDRCKATFAFIEQIADWLDGAYPPKSIAVLHSRNSEDFYAGVLGARTGFLAQKGFVNFLLKNCYPFEVFVLERVKYEDIKDFDVLILPFPYYLPREKLKVVEEFVSRGGDILVIGELGAVDQNFTGYKFPPLAKILGIKSLGPPRPGNLLFGDESPILRGRAIELNRRHGYPQIEPDASTSVLSRVNGSEAGVSVCTRHGGKAVYLGTLCYDFSGAQGEVIKEILDYVLRENKPISVIKKPSDDVEIHLLCKKPNEKLILTINWTNTERSFQIKAPGITGNKIRGKYIVEEIGPAIRISDLIEQTEGPAIRIGDLTDAVAKSDLIEQTLSPYEANVLYIKGQEPE